MTQPENIKALHGLVIIRDSNGKILTHSKNLVLRQGYDMIMTRLANSVNHEFVTNIIIGNGTNTPNFSDVGITGIGAQNYYNPWVDADYTDDEQHLLVISAEIPSGTPLVGHNLTTVGLLQVGTMNLFSRVLLEDPVAILASTNLDIEYYISDEPITVEGIFDSTFDKSFE